MDISDYSIYLIEMTEGGSVLDGHIISGEPLVSVSVITYNHGKYIRQCLDGILMQKVNFPYEVLIHDDASPDDTADIIHEYEARFPTVIKPIYQTENQYSQGRSISKFNFDRAKGKYIAQCEGDDYWTDSGKLQMQVDFLEVHEEYVGCGHSVKVVNDKGETIENSNSAFVYLKDHEFTLNDVGFGKVASQTGTLLFRNDIFRKLSPEMLEKYYACKANGDRKLSALLACSGKFYCFNKIMSCYRYVTSTGTSWNARNANKNLTLHYYNSAVSIKDFIEKISGYKIDMKQTLVSTISTSYIYLITHPSCTNLKIFYYVAKKIGWIITIKEITYITLYKIPRHLLHKNS